MREPAERQGAQTNPPPVSGRGRVEGWRGSCFVTVTRKLHLDAAVARRKVELLAEFDVATPDVADVLAAIDLRLNGFSFWDALVVRAAKQAGCRVLLTEDLQRKQEVDGVRIVNPFPLSANVRETAGPPELSVEGRAWTSPWVAQRSSS